jgi:hypothetical protein
MTEKKIETLFNEAVIVGNLLDKNLQQFETTHHTANRVYANIEKLAQTIKQISLYGQEMKQKEAQRFANEIREQVDRYYTALQEVNLDTTAIEKLIDTHDNAVLKQISRLEESAKNISETIHKNGDAIIAAAGILKRSKIGVMWSVVMFGAGSIMGALFLSAYPIAEATKIFYAELKERDVSVQALKEQYETNNNTLEFLRKNNISIKNGITDDSWDNALFRVAPMLLLPKNRVIVTDEINEYTRIIFKKIQETENDL